MNYTTSGIDYNRIDPFKRGAQAWGSKTSRGMDVAASRGESAFVWEEKDCYRAMVVEGLGTKNLVADAMGKINGKTYYGAIAQDTVAMIVNDLITVGATPQVVHAYFAVGSSNWFSNKQRSQDLIRGWARSCKLAGAVWGGGETPVLKGIIAPDTIDLAGSAVGIIKPKKRLLSGNRIKPGDAIILVESSGIHANGLTLARAIADRLPHGFATKLSDGLMYGEALLRPTLIYVRFLQAVSDAEVDIHYAVNITGHGWRKLMRAKRNLTYIIEEIPPPPVFFQFIQQHGKLHDREMYATFNMGAGFAIIAPKQDAPQIIAIAKRYYYAAWHVGFVSDGKRQVVIRPKHITFISEALHIRD